ncbi:MAG: ComEC/Rec2 family competence protein [Anaerolineae bacterium]|nr:ComEC/Rec2 family competence protein [Anaerolineae bacterium]
MRLVYLALGWAAGIIVIAAYPGLRLPALWLVVAVISALIAWRFRLASLLIAAAFSLGALRMASVPETSDLAAYNGLGGMTVEGIVAAEPDRRDDRVQLRLAAESITRAGATLPADGVVLVNAPLTTDAHYGDRIAATGLLLEPGESDRFSYADYLARSGVHSIMRESAVTVIQRAPGDDGFSRLLDLKTRAADAINRHLPEPQAGLLTGILLGSERGIAPDVSDAFAATGAAHVIAISGFNMAVLSGVVIGVLRRLKLRPMPAALISIAVLGIYTVFVGANPAVARAALMSGLVIVGRALRRETYLPASLAFAALILSLLNPLVLWDVSFQLSFFATLGLALFAEPFTRGFDAVTAHLRSPRIRQILGTLLTEPLIVTLAALVFTLPLTMLYFGQFSPAVLLVNLLIVPVQPAVLLLGGAATLTAAVVQPLAQILYWLDLIPLSWTIEVVRLFARLPTAEVFISPNLIAAFFIVVIGAAMLRAVQPKWSLNLLDWLRRRAVVGAALLSGAGILVLTGALFISRPDGLLHVWFLDAGGSSAVLIQTPRGAHMLIDGGRYPSRLLTALGDRLPFTDQTLEILFLTQPDEAQFAALPAVLDRYGVGVVVSNGQPNLGAAFGELQAKLAPYTHVDARTGYTFTSDDGVRIEALNPPRAPALEDSLDDNALALRLHYGNVILLMISDLSAEGQQTLVASGQDLRAAALQVPGELDADFAAAVQPTVAVTQVEYPDEDDLMALGETTLYRTERDGAIHLSSDGINLWVGSDSRR